MEKERLEFKDDFVVSLFENANRKELPDDFEYSLMDSIHARDAHKKAVVHTLKKSMFYFFIAILLIGLFSLVIILNRSIFEHLTTVVPVVVLFFSILGSVVFFTNYRRIFQSMSV